MTTILDWMLRTEPGLAVADYEALPDEVRRQVEIIDGGFIVSGGPEQTHQRITRRLANALEVVSPNRLVVEVQVDVRLREAPFLIRRPDVAVYEAPLPDDEVLRPEHCLLVIEVMSPRSVTTDRADKPAEYAAFDIPQFWRVEYDDSVINVLRYRRDLTTQRYALVGVDKDKLSITDPIAVDLDLETLR